MFDSTDYSDGTLKRLDNSLYETTPAEPSHVVNTRQTGRSDGTEPTYESINPSSTHPKIGSRHSASGESMSSGEYT